MKKIIALALLLILCFAVVSLIAFFNAEHSEPSWVMWSQTYGGAENDYANSVVQTSDGGYAIAGSTQSFGAGNTDFWLVKTDGAGNMKWSRTYGGEVNDIAYSLVQTSDGGFALAGEANSFIGESADFWLVKTDERGNMEWNRTYGGIGNDRAKSLIQTSDGGYALAGSTEAFGAGEWDSWLVKTDEYGDMEWNKTYGGTRSEGASSLIVTSDGGFALAGSTSSFGVGLINFWLVKTDGAGNMEWNQTYGSSIRNFFSSLIEVSDGGFVMAGDIHSGDAGGENFWLVKTDGAGNMEWNQTYIEADMDRPHSLVQTSDGGFALAGETKSFGAGNFDFWLVKTDGLGNKEWNRTYGGADIDRANSVVQTSDGGYAVAGNTLSFGAGSYDFWLVKTNAQGIPEFPSWTILPLLLAATVVVIVYRKKLYRTQTQQSY